MSDPPFPSSPDADIPRSAPLPTRRSPAEPPEDSPEPVSLEEMMERLSRSTESRSTRRRRSSTRRTHQPLPEASNPTESPLPRRAVLPPPRTPGLPASSPRPLRQSPRAPRRRLWLFALLALVFLAAAAWLGLRFLNRWRIEGEGFRVNAARRLSELVGRPTSLARFRQLGPNQLGNPSLSLSPLPQDLLDSLTLTDLSAQFNPTSWLADDWAIRSLRIGRADFAFQPSKILDDQTRWKSTPLPVDRGAPAPVPFRLGMTSDPAAVLLDSGSFSQLNLSWPGPSGKPESLANLQGNFRSADQAILLELTGGTLDTAAWPPFPVRQLNARLHGATLEIISARLGLTADHEVRLSGSAELVPEGRLQLTADIAPLLLKHLLPDAWASSVLGTFQAQGAQWLSHFHQGPPATLSGPFTVKGLVLRGLPFVDKIAALLQKPELSLLEFPSLSGQFDWTPQGTRLSKLSATSADGLLRLQGEIAAVPGASIAATLVVTANEAYFASLPPDDPTLFQPTPQGERALTFTLSGSEGAPSDSIDIKPPAILPKIPLPQDEPRLTLPPPAATPPRPAPRPAPLSPPPKPSDAELERSFQQLLGR